MARTSSGHARQAAEGERQLGLRAGDGLAGEGEQRGGVGGVLVRARLEALEVGADRVALPRGRRRRRRRGALLRALGLSALALGRLRRRRGRQLRDGDVAHLGLDAAELGHADLEDRVGIEARPGLFVDQRAVACVAAGQAADADAVAGARQVGRAQVVAVGDQRREHLGGDDGGELGARGLQPALVPAGGQAELRDEGRPGRGACDEPVELAQHALDDEAGGRVAERPAALQLGAVVG
jgi:hypothetical protein